MVLLTAGGLAPHFWGTKIGASPRGRGQNGAEEAGNSILWACANRVGIPYGQIPVWRQEVGLAPQVFWKAEPDRYLRGTGAQPLDCSEDEPAASLSHCAKRRLRRE